MQGPPATSVVINSVSVPSVNVGQAGSKSWGELGTVVYRADVTTQIKAPWNGNYSIDITGLTNKNSEVDGVTMIVIYKDNAATYQGSMILWDGARTCCSCAFTETMTNVNACAGSTNAKGFLVVSDMQGTITPPQHLATINGSTKSYSNDFYNFNIDNTSVSGAQPTASFGTSAPNTGADCYNWSLMGLYYQTTTCTTCVPTALSVSVSSTQSSCGQPNGSATASLSGAVAPYTFSWSTGASTSAIQNLPAGLYTVTVTDATGCSSVQTVSVLSSGNLTATVGSSTISCSANSAGSATITPTGGQGPFTYSWSTSPPQVTSVATGLSAGTYSVQISDASGCTATYTVAVSGLNAFTTSVSVLNNVSCNGGSDGEAIATTSGGLSPFSYFWTPTGNNTQVVSGLAAGSYSVTVTDGNGCTSVMPITIAEPPAIQLPTITLMASCGASDGVATVNPSGGNPPYSYLWLTQPSVQVTPTASGLAAGNYSVIVTDANGCFQNQMVTISGTKPPVADFSLSSDVISLENPQVYFTDLSTGGVGSWYWSFGDPLSGADDSSSLQHPDHIYSDAGLFCATLIVVDTSGSCSDTTTKCVKVEPETTFYIPNSFTPNFDGVNEVFQAYGTNIQEFQMWIFDRWGNLIFETNDIQKGWDGTVKNKGNIVQEDVYVWKVRFTDGFGREHFYVGHVNMIK